MTIKTAPLPIPQPPSRLVLGNLADMRREATPTESLMALAREYGPIFQLQMPRGRMIAVSGPELVDEICDEARFDKAMGPGLEMVRQRIGDGLFTAYTWEPNWQKAHRILMPPFSQASMKAYLPGMVEIASQMMGYLEGLAPGTDVDVPAVMTKLTLDTIALCGFSYRFDSFRTQATHPFIEAMVDVLTQQQAAVARPPALNRLMVGARRRTEEAAAVMNRTVDAIIAERRGQGGAGDDLLAHMLTGVDKQTGESLDDANIRSQCITFLVAGHETTSGLLSFAVHFLLKNPEVLARAYEEVDRVLGGDLERTPDYEQVHSLAYLEQILKEALRIWPTAPAFSRAPLEDTLLGGCYEVPKGQVLTVIIPSLHRATSVWGDDVERFNPDRFTPEAEAARPPNTFLPFGTGARACIGRQFALQEAKLVLGMLLQRFEIWDPGNYQLRIKQSLTIKPADFFVRLRRRAVRPATRPAPAEPPQADSAAPALATAVPFQILFGSNLGAGEGFANDLARLATQQGCPVRLAPLDDAVGQLACEGLVAIVCSSYNGTPPDNAVAFCKWLEEAQEPVAQGVRFAVFGCGNREWTNTYQKIPRFVDERLEALGGRRLLPLGEGDARHDLDGDFRGWLNRLWGALGASPEAAVPPASGPLFSVEVLEESHPNPFAEIYGAVPMVVVENRELQTGGGRSTRHLELALPDGSRYGAGDHLGVIPRNGPALVRRAAAAFGLTPETRIRLHQREPGRSSLPEGRILAVGSLLTHYVELQEPAARRHLEVLAGYAGAPAERLELEALATDPERYRAEVRGRSRSLLDLLEDYPSAALAFGHYLELVSSLKARYYSISSSPLASGQLLSLTVGVVAGPARSGHGEFRGSCSNYLAGLKRGDTVYAFLPESPGTFRLPGPARTPIVMIGAGTGLAPFRGFLQERAALREAGREVGPALLFFGCRHPEQDYLYRDELEEYQRQGLVELVTAFSRAEENRKVYVQDRLREHGERVWQLLEKGGTLYVCGDAAGMATGVHQALLEIVGRHADDAQRHLDELSAEGRYALDVWASN